MSKKYYRMLLFADSAVRIGEGEELQSNFTNPDGTVECRFVDVITHEYGIDVHKGVQATVKVETDVSDINMIIGTAGGIADSFLTFASFSSAATISPLKVHLVYDITPGIRDREFVQFIYNLELPSMAKRTLPIEKYRWLIENLQIHKDMKRLGRAMRWYRKASLESDRLERFLNLWLGLESLNQPLVDKYNVQPITAKCPKCEYEKTIPTSVGIRYLMTQHIENGEALYKSSIKIRRGLVHGFDDLDVLTNEADSLTPDLEKALVKGLLLLLEVPSEEHDQWIKEAISYAVLPYIKVAAILHEPDMAKLEASGSYPHFAASHVIVNAKQEANGSTTYTITSNLEPKFNCIYTPQYIELYGPREGVKMQITSTA